MPKTKLNCHDQSNMVWCKMKMSQEYDVIDSSPIGVVRIQPMVITLEGE